MKKPNCNTRWLESSAYGLATYRTAVPAGSHSTVRFSQCATYGLLATQLLIQNAAIIVTKGVAPLKGEDYAFILITDEKYWERIRQRSTESGGTIAFVRKGQVGPVRARKAIFYVKKPVKQIRGVAELVERVKGDSGEMWARYGKESCFKTEEEYDSFIQGRDKVTFLRLKSFSELSEPRTGEEISMILGSLRGFRGKYVDKETAEALTT